LERKWWVLIAVGVGTLMAALDGSVVNTALPVITSQFHSELAVTSWIVTIYLLSLSGLLLNFGRLGDLYGHKRVYVGGYVIFVLGSILCGQAPSIGFLIAARAFQAVGAAMLASNGPAILTASFPGAQRGQALGMSATMTYLGLSLGPTIGGFLTTLWGWRSIFYINVPVGLLALGLSWFMIPGAEKHKTSERFDPAGALTFFVGLVGLLLALNRGRDWGWGSAPTLGILAAALLILAGFVVLELRRQHPMLDLSLFKVWLFSASAASAVLNYVCLYGITLLIPFYLIQQRALPPDRAGLLLSAQPLVMAVMAPLSGTLSDKFGSRLLSTAGMLILALALVGLSTLGAATPTWRIILNLACVGLGVGIFTSPNNNALMGAAPRHRQGVAAGVLATARSVGMALGVGINSALFTSVELAAQKAGRPDAFLLGLHTTFLAMAGVAVAGAVLSSLRGKPA
jgi:EmrB/QacA subfamily drug resistance transporter